MSAGPDIAPADLLLRAEAWQEISPASSGWAYVSFAVESLPAGGRLGRPADDREWAIVPLSGAVEVAAGGETWGFGTRTSVFDGRGDCLYLPRDTAFVLTACAGAEVALCASRCERRLAPRPGQPPLPIRECRSCPAPARPRSPRRPRGRHPARRRAHRPDPPPRR